MHDNFGTCFCLVARGNGVAVRSFRNPTVSLLFVFALGAHLNFVTDHKGGVKADAELTDNVDIVLFFHRLFKIKGAAFGDGA